MYQNYNDYNKAYGNPSDAQSNVSSPYIYDLMHPNDFFDVKPHVDMIIVDAWAPWCQPCKHAMKKLHHLGEKYKSLLEQKRLLLLKDNIDLEETSLHRHLVDVVPTFFVYQKGIDKPIGVFTGMDFDKLEHTVESFFFSHHSMPISNGQIPQQSPALSEQRTYPHIRNTAPFPDL